MKIKCTPEDFLVEELTSELPLQSGRYTFYRLLKSNRTTPDALNLVGNHWKIPSSAFHFGGLKDRHAKTTQYFTIDRGPAKNLTVQNISVECMGYLNSPYTSKDIDANFFNIVIRDVEKSEVSKLQLATYGISKNGVPNYFDDQRFGSVTHDTMFIAEEMVHGRFESALRIAIATRYPFDKPKMKMEKEIIHANWGNWSKCHKQLAKSSIRGIVEHLREHPTDYLGALIRLNPELQGLYLGAFQSHVWNEMLRLWINEHLLPEELSTIQLKLGSYPVPVCLPENLRGNWESLELLLPSARIKDAFDILSLQLATKVLNVRGLSIESMKIPGVDKPFFSKGLRSISLKPSEMSMEYEKDSSHEGKYAVRVSFKLQRGSYATMVLKSLNQLM